MGTTKSTNEMIEYGLTDLSNEEAMFFNGGEFTKSAVRFIADLMVTALFASFAMKSDATGWRVAAAVPATLATLMADGYMRNGLYDRDWSLRTYWKDIRHALSTANDPQTIVVKK